MAKEANEANEAKAKVKVKSTGKGKGKGKVAILFGGVTFIEDPDLLNSVFFNLYI